MAVPFIVGAVVASGVTGLYKGIKAWNDGDKAESVNRSANRIVEKAQDKLERSRTNCQTALENLGRRKADALAVNVQNFLAVFGKIKNVDFEHDGDLGNLNLKEFSPKMLQNMQESVSFVLSSGLTGVGAGAVGGALTAFGAYSGTAMFATAGTGTAISTLSGAAATNATLAWLGGGTLASGGMGIAGGMAALGGLVAGPALLIAGWYMGSQAESKLNDAYSNLAEAEKFQADINAAVALTDGIGQVAEMAGNIISELRKHARRSLNHLQLTIDMQGVDYSQYDEEAKLLVLRNVKIMQVLKAVIDTPILDEQGNLLGDAESNLMDLHRCIQSDFKG